MHKNIRKSMSNSRSPFIMLPVIRLEMNGFFLIQRVIVFGKNLELFMLINGNNSFKRVNGWNLHIQPLELNIYFFSYFIPYNFYKLCLLLSLVNIIQSDEYAFCARKTCINFAKREQILDKSIL